MVRRMKCERVIREAYYPIARMLAGSQRAISSSSKEDSASKPKRSCWDRDTGLHWLVAVVGVAARERMGSYWYDRDAGLLCELELKLAVAG